MLAEILPLECPTPWFHVVSLIPNTNSTEEYPRYGRIYVPIQAMVPLPMLSSNEPDACANHPSLYIVVSLR